MALSFPKKVSHAVGQRVKEWKGRTSVHNRSSVNYDPFRRLEPSPTPIAPAPYISSSGLVRVHFGVNARQWCVAGTKKFVHRVFSGKRCVRDLKCGSKELAKAGRTVEFHP